jgi:mono/diheme cytochrome c family protein
MKVSVSLCAAVAAGLILVSPTARADDAGQKEYMNACASCHGPAGLGDGPMAEFMSVKVPDLTQLSAQNDGVFPMLDVIQMVDGRTGVRAHGSEMPVWGNQFKGEASAAGPYGGEVIARGRVLSLAYYLESIQK